MNIFPSRVASNSNSLIMNDRNFIIIIYLCENFAILCSFVFFFLLLMFSSVLFSRETRTFFLCCCRLCKSPDHIFRIFLATLKYINFISRKISQIFRFFSHWHNFHKFGFSIFSSLEKFPTLILVLFFKYHTKISSSRTSKKAQKIPRER